MLRRIVVLVAVVAVAFAGSATAAPAAVVIPPPEGTLSCGLSGTGKFAPAYPSASDDDGSNRTIRFKLKGVLGPCDNRGVTGGKYPITNGKLDFSARLPVGSGCNDLLWFGVPDFTSEERTKLSMTFNGTTDAGKRPKVAKAKTTVFDGSQISQGWQLTSDWFPAERETDPFQDHTATISLIVDNLGELGACAFGGPDLALVTFSAAGGAKVEVAP
jgi:hypothetical protein